MLKNTIVDKIQKKFDKENYDIVDSIGLIATLGMEGIRPLEIMENGRLKNGRAKHSAVYLIDSDYTYFKAKWDNGFYDIYKIYNRYCGKAKEMLIKKDIHVLDY